MSDWKLADGTDLVKLYVPVDHKEQWQAEAAARNTSASQYLHELIQEARAYRDQGYLAHHDAEATIEQLQARIEQFEQQLEETQQRNSANTTVNDPEFLDQFLTYEYKPLEQLLKEIVESGAFDDLLRKPVENQLYFLASQDTVEYERGHGWRLTDEKEEEVITDG